MILRMCETNNDFELAKQLHEQFAKSDNSKNMYILTFIGSMSFVLIGFGYACWNYSPSDRMDVGFIGITMATVLVLSLLSIICIHFGYTMRRDQMVIYRIRKKYMKDSYLDVFKFQYNPFGKSFFQFLISFYFLILLFLIISIIGVYIMARNIYDGENDVFITVAFIVSIIVIFIFYCYYFKKYSFVKS